MADPQKRQRQAAHGKGRLARQRAWESIKMSAFGSAELVVGVVVHYAASAGIHWFVELLGHHGPEVFERRAVLVLQWTATAAFVVHGLVNILLGIALATRSAYRDWNDDPKEE